MVLKVLKSLTEAKYLQFLMQNFESNEIQYIEKFKNARNGELIEIFEVKKKYPCMHTINI